MSNDTGTLTLTEFLLARIAEDEAVARASLRDWEGYGANPPRKDDGVWATGTHAMDECRVEGTGIMLYDEGGHSHEQAVHIARHDPARVLAECEAHRRIVNEHRIPAVRFSGGEVWAPCILALAAVYADHPDYRDEWSNE